MSIKASRFYGIGLAALTIGAFAACSSDDPVTPPGTAGTGASTAGTSSAGTASTAGTSAGGTSSTAGTSAGGTSTTAGTGTGGTSTAGAGGSGGGTGFACAGMKPAGNLITAFEDLVANPTSAGNFTYTLGVPGGTFAYQAADVKSTDASKALNIKGNVKTYDGFGLYTTACTDASAFTGVSFSIKGNVGAGGKLSFRVQTNATTAVDAVNKKGTCVPLSATDTYASCHPSAFDIPVTAEAKTVEVKWSDLTGGVPVAAVDGKDVVGLEWAFAWTEGGTAFDVDVTLDDVKFIGGGNTGGGGAGGGGGGGAGGGGGGGAGGGGNGGTGGTN